MLGSSPSIGSAGGSPAGKRYACIKQPNSNNAKSLALSSLPFGQMRASRPRPQHTFQSKNACLKNNIFQTGILFKQKKTYDSCWLPNCGNTEPSPSDSKPVCAYKPSLPRVSTMSRLRMVSWPIRSAGVKAAFSTFSMLRRSGW